MTETENIKKTEDILNTMDILRLYDEFSNGKEYTVGDFMYDLGEHFISNDKYRDVCNGLPFEGYLFNWMNDVEFMDYVEERYRGKVWFSESTRNYLHIKR